MAVNRSLVLCCSAGPSPPGTHGNLGKWVCPSPALPALSILPHPPAMPFIPPPRAPRHQSGVSCSAPNHNLHYWARLWSSVPHIPLRCDPSSTVACPSCACEMVEIRGKRAGGKVSPAGGPRHLPRHGCVLSPPSLLYTRCSG